jgi:hypothetical protein
MALMDDWLECGGKIVAGSFVELVLDSPKTEFFGRR